MDIGNSVGTSSYNINILQKRLSHYKWVSVSSLYKAFIGLCSGEVYRCDAVPGKEECGGKRV